MQIYDSDVVQCHDVTELKAGLMMRHFRSSVFCGREGFFHRWLWPFSAYKTFYMHKNRHKTVKGRIKMKKHHRSPLNSQIRMDFKDLSEPFSLHLPSVSMCSQYFRNWFIILKNDCFHWSLNVFFVCFSGQKPVLVVRVIPQSWWVIC